MFKSFRTDRSFQPCPIPQSKFAYYYSEYIYAKHSFMQYITMQIDLRCFSFQIYFR